ncbi:MAG: NAD(P)H-hydrate epimerase, partial [Planctomycetota bacterium]|nr:NAD(P)H-hydrate epimerase [Planctomycetota bacterium]
MKDAPSYRPASAAEVRELDRKAIEGFGIPGFTLMQNAGQAAAEVARRMLNGGSIATVVCGKGNNGGDGFVIAHLLKNDGYDIRVFGSQSPTEIKSDAKEAMHLLEKADGDPYEVLEETTNYQHLVDSLLDSDLIVDALLGTGISRPVYSPLSEAIDLINQTGKPVLSVDVPSGLNADTGEIMGTCVSATETVTFALPKAGFFIEDGPDMVGHLTVARIGIPDELLAPFLQHQTSAV